jgi:NAD(P)-dependent dehydrogenase (short-subunit alcohol dehydrogenase family)
VLSPETFQEKNMGRLAGKYTLITGGTSGIGLATAQAFIAEGAQVAVTGRNPETLAEAQRILGDKAWVILPMRAISPHKKRWRRPSPPAGRAWTRCLSTPET